MRKTKTAFLGVMTALALIFSYVESLVPIPIPVPGIKLGLANLMVVVLLFTVGTKEAFWMNLARILLSGFLFGNLFFHSVQHCRSLGKLWSDASAKKGQDVFPSSVSALPEVRPTTSARFGCGGSIGKSGSAFLCTDSNDYRGSDWISHWNHRCEIIQRLRRRKTDDRICRWKTCPK